MVNPSDPMLQRRLCEGLPSRWVRSAGDSADHWIQHSVRISLWAVVAFVRLHCTMVWRHPYLASLPRCRDVSGLSNTSSFRCSSATKYHVLPMASKLAHCIITSILDVDFVRTEHFFDCLESQGGAEGCSHLCCLSGVGVVGEKFSAFIGWHCNAAVESPRLYHPWRGFSIPSVLVGFGTCM